MRPRSPEERLKISFAAHSDWDVGRRANALGVPAPIVRAFAARHGKSGTPAEEHKSPSKPADVPHTTGGILLDRVKVFAQRPQDRAKQLIYGLTAGRGFPIADLVEQWGMSEETIIKHARRLGTYRYVEKQPGVYVPCVLHPDSAKKYGG